MKNRQKSFFDQRTAKTHQPWRKDWRPSSASRPVEPPPKIVNAMPPIAASSQSKSKLKAFQFKQNIEGRPPNDQSMETLNAEKENTSPEPDQMAAAPMNPPPQPASQRSASKEVRECPQTPVGRLPLSQLLTNGDDARQNIDLTPVERVLWDNSPIDSEGPGSVPTRKRRRRNHSMSPVSSSQNETSVHFGSKSATEVSALPQVFKTPKADPADDLWIRYSLNTGNKKSPTALADLPFAHLMHSSSPQTPANHKLGRDNGGLRRAHSCIEWPTSGAKRRKLQHSSSQRNMAGGLVVTEEQDDPAKGSRLSRVSFLIEKIHDDLAKPARKHQYSSSEPTKSSPVLPRSVSPHLEASLSQQSNKIVEAVVNVLSQTVVDDVQSPEERVVLTTEEIANLNRSGSSSEFGDDDFDLEMLQAATSEKADHPESEPHALIREEGSGQGKPVVANEQTAKVSMEATFENLLPSPGSQKPVKLKTSSGPSSSTLKQDISAEDEFDDDESDVFAADLEDVFARYDTQPTAHVAKGIETQREETKATAPPVARTGGSKAETNIAVEEVQVLSDDDDFGGDSDFEHIAAECEAAQPQQTASRPQTSSDRKYPSIQRYIIKAVVEGEHETNTGFKQAEKVLSVQCEKTKLSKVILLRQAWIDGPYVTGAFLHLIGDFDRFGQCVVDNAQNFLVLHPDHLLSSTTVGDSFSCTRKAVLQDRVKTTSDANQSTIYGSMLHEIFQEALRKNRWDNEFMAITIDTIAKRYLETLFEISIEHSMAIDHLKARVVDLQAWAEIFVAATPKPNAVVRDRNGAQALVCINKLLEVEEKVWSPLYGLKGNVDATVQIQLQDGDGEKTLTVPFELKTGKISNASHKAQTSLYTLLLSDRYDVDIVCGVLYYMQTSEISSIRTLRHEVVPMILQRNRLASFIRNRVELPPMLKQAYTCNKCYAKTPCFIYHKLVENGNGETSGLGDKFEEVVKHLNHEHRRFLSKWDELLTKEEKDVVIVRRELWTMQSSERERIGRCFGGLVIDAGSFHEETDAPKINRFQYTFVKKAARIDFSFTESLITLGEPVVISDENGHFALANGYVTRVRKQSIQVTVDRRLHSARTKMKNFDSERNQVFTGIMEVVQDGNTPSTMTPVQPEEPVVYRLDKDEFANGMAMIRNNLIRLMEKDIFGVQALRRLIVEAVAPTFKPIASGYSLEETASQASLNVDQRAAIEKVMSAKDYALVLGMPGTGKTTTIAHIIRALVAQGKSVLLTSYTHTAVDNILLKLRHDNIGIFRLGAVAKVHPEVQEFADLAGRPIKTMEELKTCYTRKVVATTCLGINHPIFNQRVFDYCIVDEASQITLPVCLGPIRMARTFILVGDHYQLPPLVQNKEAIEGGLDISLFKMLSEKHPASVVSLEHQYRMCEDIMTLSNTLIYEGRLKCGTPAVASRSINIPNMPALKQHHHTTLSLLSANPTTICQNPTMGACWLRDLLSPSAKATLVNTDPLLPSSREILENGSRITNPVEATLTAQLVESLITTGVAPTDIGVIALYRSQLALLKHSLRHRSGVEMHTADRFQGRDKEVIVLSLVRSNEGRVVGDLLKDWRRVNVAFTRARSKLLILGSKSTLLGNELLSDFVKLMEGRQWCYDLPSNACTCHVFEDVSTQVSGRGSAELLLGQSASAKIEKEKAGSAEGKENKRGMKMPGKQAKLDVQAWMGRRPVLRDIVNDAG